MILGIGLDVVETARMERALAEQGRAFEQRVFTTEELRECAPRPDQAMALAGRFAAKEACVKALGTGFASGVTFQQVEILNGDGGGARISLSGKAAERAQVLGVRRVHVTLSHEPGIAAAVVILEGE